MNEAFFEKFPAEEHEKRRKICVLMEEWANVLSHVEKKDPYEEGVVRTGADFFVDDGFYPHYTKQTHKILFIGREAVSIWNHDYIELLLDAYNNNATKKIGEHSIGQSPMHRRMMYLAYGILHDGKLPYHEVRNLKASKIAADFGTEKGISFAFMNFSKYSNEGPDANKHRDAGLMNAFFADSKLEKRNFFQEELAILDPDIIITMNLWETGVEPQYLEIAFDKLFVPGPCEYKTDDANLCFFKINGKIIPRIDLFHFTARKSDKISYYDPVMDIVQNHLKWK